jgi:hypothetical protein
VKNPLQQKEYEMRQSLLFEDIFVYALALISDQNRTDNSEGDEYYLHNDEYGQCDCFARVFS